MIHRPRRQEIIPEQRDTTIRQELVRLLTGTQLPAGELSKAIRKSEKEIYDHLDHLQRAGILVIIPAECGDCGYVFEHRVRPKKPGKCPRCKGSYIVHPLFSIATP